MAGSKSGGRIADAMPDRRNPDRIEHAMFEMVGARAAAIACGYEDANDLELAARAGAAASKAMPVILTTELLAGAAGAAAAVWSQAVRWRHRGLASDPLAGGVEPKGGPSGTATGADSFKFRDNFLFTLGGALTVPINGWWSFAFIGGFAEVN